MPLALLHQAVTTQPPHVLTLLSKPVSRTASASNLVGVHPSRPNPKTFGLPPRPPRSNLGANPHGTPTSAEELLQPLTRPETSSNSLPAWAASYMTLLADSSSSPGSMQRHLVKLLARGVSGASKTAQFLTDPLDPVKGVLATKGSHLIMQGACKVAHKVAASHGTTDQLEVTSAAPPPTPAGRPGPMTTRAKSADDLTCEQAHPLEGKLLTLVLSMLMSAGTSGAMVSLQDLLPNLPFPLPGTFTELAATPAPPAQMQKEVAAAAALLTAPSLQAAPSLQSAASLLTRVSPSWGGGDSGLESVLGAGGMATSTAMRLLRADSKLVVLPDLGNLLDSVLDAVRESMDEEGGVTADEKKLGSSGGLAAAADEKQGSSAGGAGLPGGEAA